MYFHDSLGAEGLDLIVASHIFLLEPLLSPALEEQAINRIDRIGQTKPTFIYRYVIKDTVEEKIYNSREHDSVTVVDAVNDPNQTADLPIDYPVGVLDSPSERGKSVRFESPTTPQSIIHSTPSKSPGGFLLRKEGHKNQIQRSKYDQQDLSWSELKNFLK